MTFKEWMKQFIYEDSKSGELAKIIWEDIHFPNTDKWIDVNYRLRLVNENLDLFITLNVLWQKYKAEYGENILFFDLMNSDGKSYVNDFIKEKEAYQFMFKLQGLGLDFDLISEAEGSEDDCFIIEINEAFKRPHYLSLDEIVNELNKLKNVIPFPLRKVTK